MKRKKEERDKREKKMREERENKSKWPYNKIFFLYIRMSNEYSHVEVSKYHYSFINNCI